MRRDGAAILLGALTLSFVAGCVGGHGPGAADPQSVAIYDVANDEFHKGRLREALAKVQEALKVDSDNADAEHLGALVHLAFCSRDTGTSDCRFDEAERLARGAVDDDPENREAKNTLGVILIHEKKFDQAIKVLKPLTADILYNSPQVSWGNLGWAYLEKGSYDEAIDALRRSVASQPAFCVGNYRLGLAYEKKKEIRAAREAFKRAVETDRPGCKKIQEAWEGLARSERHLGMLQDARSSYGQCVELAKDSPSRGRCATGLKTLPAAPAEATQAAAPAERPAEGS